MVREHPLHGSGTVPVRFGYNASGVPGEKLRLSCIPPDFRDMPFRFFYKIRIADIKKLRSASNTHVVQTQNATNRHGIVSFFYPAASIPYFFLILFSAHAAASSAICNTRQILSSVSAVHIVAREASSSLNRETNCTAPKSVKMGSIL